MILYKDLNYKSSSKKDIKKENTLDYYISKSKSNTRKWWKDAEEHSNSFDKYKYEFLKNNVKASTVVPDELFKEEEVPDNMGCFETPFGTMEVGHRKYDNKSDIAFSIVPDEVKEESRLPERKLTAPNTYFGGEKNHNERHFKASSLSFKVDMQRDDRIEKLIPDDDGMYDEQDKLLYQDEIEDKRLETLKLTRGENKEQREAIQEEMQSIREIKREKQQDNDLLVKEIIDFVKKFKKDKVKMKIESDEVMTRRRRIEELDQDLNLDMLDIYQIRRLLEKLWKEKRLKKFVKKEEIDKMSKLEIIKIIKSLISDPEIA